jgi:hypothetical protein
MPVAEHLVASTRGRVRTLCEPVHAKWLWTQLGRAFPEPWSLVLMPDHLHLVADPGGEADLDRVLKAFTRKFGVRVDPTAPQSASSRDIAARKVRYGLFNPVRAGLVDDPWSWPWSSLRDLGGVCHPIWIPLEALASRLRRRPDRCLSWLSTIGDCRVPPLRIDPPEAASFAELRAAVGGALRIPAADVVQTPVGRRLLVQLAAELPEPPRTGLLAERMGLTPRSVQRLRYDPHPGLAAARRCLADPRLRLDVAELPRRPPPRWH